MSNNDEITQIQGYIEIKGGEGDGEVVRGVKGVKRKGEDVGSICESPLLPSFLPYVLFPSFLPYLFPSYLISLLPTCLTSFFPSFLPSFLLLVIV